ncbi:Methyltransferase type 11 [Dillenia turbinata]|uniref:Methyltransferase type 11 n=1 Tax=Dillenia turbinata TaxID=194707 RepID=A0AAN8V9S0_9MAGN
MVPRNGVKSGSRSHITQRERERDGKFVSETVQAYSLGRPTYPRELFQFIASKTPQHDLAWDVGTGTGQAAQSLAGIYKNVIATDASETLLNFTPKLPNIQYKCTPPKLTMEELKHAIVEESRVDVVTVAQAVHWFDLPTFYQQVKWVLKKPHGVMAVVLPIAKDK